MSPSLLLLASLASSPYHEQALRRVVTMPRSGVLDLRRQGQLGDGERRTLESLVQEYGAAGFHLRVVFLDAGPSFSLGDFTSRAQRAARGGTSDVLLTVSSTGVHAGTPWHAYGDVRLLARGVGQHFAAAPTAAVLDFGRGLLVEGRARNRHRRLMVGVAAVAGVGLVGLFAAAWVRRRRRRGAATGG